MIENSKGGLELNTREVTQKYRLNQWTELIRECRSSGQTIAAWCADHNIKENCYYYWLKKVREAACENLPSPDTENNPIVPVNIPIHTAGMSSVPQRLSPDIVLHLGTVTIEIRNNASETLIKNTLRALQNVR